MDKRCLLVALTLIGGCSGSPAAPSGSKVTSITITGGDLLLIGKGETFIATGNSGPVAVRWGSDAPSVAVVDPTTGRVSAVGKGTATIYADANGIRGTKLIRTLPDFAGKWTISYQVTRCEADGDYLRYRACDYPPNWIELELIQSGEGISGRFGMTDWDSYDWRSDNVLGSVSSDGTMSFTATATSGDMRIENVRLELRPNRQLAGTFEHVQFDRTGSVRYFLEVPTANPRSGG